MENLSANPGLDLYLVQAAAYGRLSTRDQATLARWSRNPTFSGRGRAWARRRLITANLLLVPANLKYLAYRRDLAPELVAAGNLALVRAADGFDPGRGVRFSSYASWAIRHEMGRYLKSLREPGRVPAAGPLDQVPAAVVPAWAIAEAQAATSDLSRLLGRLHPRWASVLKRYALDGQTLDRIARDEGFSKQRARQIRDSALGRLRAYARGR